MEMYGHYFHKNLTCPVYPVQFPHKSHQWFSMASLCLRKTNEIVLKHNFRGKTKYSIGNNI